MRIRLLLLLLCVLLCGCSDVETFETLGPMQHQTDKIPAMATLEIALPETAALQTFGSGEDKVYECEGYTLVLQTLAGGDLSRTVRNLCGFTPDKLTMLETAAGDARRYDWVWTAVGESGDLLCRGAVLDDGNYHYCVSVFAPADSGGALSQQWNALFSSLKLTDAQE